MQLTLVPGVVVEFDFAFAENGTDVGKYYLTGPDRALKMLEQDAGVVTGKCSPMAPLSLPQEVRPAAGIPLAAESFVFTCACTRTPALARIRPPARGAHLRNMPFRHMAHMYMCARSQTRRRGWRRASRCST